jgi:hypothetical protein
LLPIHPNGGGDIHIVKDNMATIDDHQYFTDATFGKSVAFLTPDESHVYHNFIAQFKFHHNPYLTLKGPCHTHEQIAEKLGEFIKAEFLKAVDCDLNQKKQEWDNGPKWIVEYPDGSRLTSLVNEKKPVYSPVRGEFTSIGAYGIIG